MNQLSVGDVADQLVDSEESENESIRESQFSPKIMRFDPRDESPMHAHNERKTYHMNTGEATLATEDGSVDVEEGDVVHLDPGTEHQSTDFAGEFATR